jgi:hypothetical protein
MPLKPLASPRYRSDAIIAQEQQQIREMTRELLKDKEAARAFLIEGGFITKTGKLTKRYGG